MPVQQGFPQTSAPLVNQEGYIQQSWLRLLISLWRRTGSSQGGSTFNSGDLKPSASGDAQDGWLVCDGSAVSRTDYPSLFDAIGVVWGPGDGSTTFNIPDLQNKTLLGTSGTHLLGTYGGSATTTLAVTNLPSHNHAIIDPGHIHGITDPGHTHAITDLGHTHTDLTLSSTGTTGTNPGTATTGGTTGSSTTGITVNSHTTGVTVNSTTTGITTGNTGSATPFSTLSPFAAVTMLIKI